MKFTVLTLFLAHQYRSAKHRIRQTYEYGTRRSKPDSTKPMVDAGPDVCENWIRPRSLIG
jgi:hypothetical protein